MLTTVLRSHPFLGVGLLGIALFGIWLMLGAETRDGGLGHLLFYSWRLLAAPIHLATNVLAPVTDRWPDAADGIAAVVVGLLPYAGADWLLRRRRRRRPIL